MMVERPQIVFVHGLFSSAEVWDNLQSLLQNDDSLTEVDCHCFEYRTPKLRLSLTRKIPSFDDLADRLRTFIRLHCHADRPVILVSHSQGGLIVQRFLARSLASEQYEDIRTIKMVVMYSCPNSGSDILLSVRRGLILWRHPQEEELRPLNRLVTETRGTILRKIVNAAEDDPDSCHIPIYFYAGDEDNVVTSVSALDVFPAEYTGVIRGDHSSIIQPASTNDESYRVLRRHIRQAVERARGSDRHEDATTPPKLSGDEVPNVRELVDKALMYAQQGQNSQAEATFLQATSRGDLDALQAYSRFQRQQGQLDQSIGTSFRVIEQLADAEDTVENRVRRSKVMATIGISQRNLGKLQQSEKSLREAVLATHGNDSSEFQALAYALDNLGLTLMRGADMKAARDCFNNALRIREGFGDESKLAPSLTNIARIDLREGNLDDAADACEKALALLDHEKDAAEVAAALSLRGEVAYAKSDFQAAEDAFTEALNLNYVIGRSVSIALSQQQLGRTLLMRGDRVAAEKHARKSLENCRSASNVEGEVGARQLLARIASANGDHMGAIAVLEDCVTTYRDLGNLTGEAWSSFYLAEVLYQIDRPDAGAARLQRAAALADWITNASLRRAVEMFTPG
jgi:tetratricopeptide (TPR) repeat protein